jgi:PAS domain S-box-containing protein
MPKHFNTALRAAGIAAVVLADVLLMVWASRLAGAQLAMAMFVVAPGALAVGVALQARYRRVEARNAALLEAMPDPMFVFSDDGRFLDYHARNDRELFLPPERFLGRHVRQVMTRQLAERFLDAFARTRGSREPSMVVDYSQQVHGETRYYAAQIVACHKRNFLAVVRDVTDRQRDQETLRRNEAALRAKNKRLRDLAGRLIAAQEAERARVARDLHDDTSQKLALLSMTVDEIVQRGEPPWTAARLTELKEQVEGISRDVHRLSHALHPSTLQAVGLVAAISSCCREISSQGHVTVRFVTAGVPQRVPAETSLCLYRIVQEALANVVKHSGTRVADVALVGRENDVELCVTDQGRGFTLDTDHAGLGLVSMRERVRTLGGRFIVRSSPGQGTRIGVYVPVRSKALARERQIA